MTMPTSISALKLYPLMLSPSLHPYSRDWRLHPSQYIQSSAILISDSSSIEHGCRKRLADDAQEEKQER